MKLCRAGADAENTQDDDFGWSVQTLSKAKVMIESEDDLEGWSSVPKAPEYRQLHDGGEPATACADDVVPELSDRVLRIADVLHFRKKGEDTLPMSVEVVKVRLYNCILPTHCFPMLSAVLGLTCGRFGTACRPAHRGKGTVGCRHGSHHRGSAAERAEEKQAGEKADAGTRLTCS